MYEEAANISAKKALSVLALILPLMTGCSEEWKTPQEELAYLSSLSNPTPIQWKRARQLEVEIRRAKASRKMAIANEVKRIKGEPLQGDLKPLPDDLSYSERAELDEAKAWMDAAPERARLADDEVRTKIANLARWAQEAEDDGR